MTTSIFRLDEIRCNETESQSYLEAITSVRGYFSSMLLTIVILSYPFRKPQMLIFMFLRPMCLS